MTTPAPRPISLTQVDASSYSGPEPQSFVVVGPVPGGGGGGAVDSVNGKSGAVTLTAADVGALPTSTAIPSTPAEIGAATAAQGAKADSAVQPASIANLVPSTRKVAGKDLSADVILAKGDVGLSNVDNTSDAGKPVSTAAQTALNGKVATSRTVAGYALTSDVPRAGLNTRGVGEVVFISNGGTVPAGTPTYTIVVEAS